MFQWSHPAGNTLHLVNNHNFQHDSAMLCYIILSGIITISTFVPPNMLNFLIIFTVFFSTLISTNCLTCFHCDITNGVDKFYDDDHCMHPNKEITPTITSDMAWRCITSFMRDNDSGGSSIHSILNVYLVLIRRGLGNGDKLDVCKFNSNI